MRLPLLLLHGLLCIAPLLASVPGTLDDTFGDHGVAVFGLNVGQGQFASSTLAGFLQNGDMLFGGLTLGKLKRDGTIDTAFGMAGVTALRDVPLWVGPTPFARQQTDGRIVIGGIVYDGNRNYMLARWNADGSPDTSFFGSGKLLGLNAQSHLLLPDGRILLIRFDAKPTVRRLLVDGSPDSSYGTNGVTTTPAAGYFQNSNQGPLWLPQPDGKVILLYLAQPGSIMTRLLANGGVDLSFGQNGFVTLPASDDNALLRQVDSALLLPSGEILVANYRYGMRRFSSLGVELTLPNATSWDSILGLTADGKVLHRVRGQFGSVGYRLLDPANWTGAEFRLAGASVPNNFWSITPMPSGGYLVGRFVDFGKPLILQRYAADGSRDMSFGTGGEFNPVWTPPGDCFNAQLHEAGPGEVGVLFDQGQNTVPYSIYTPVEKLGVRAALHVSASGVPSGPFVFGNRADAPVVTFARDGRLLFATQTALRKLDWAGSEYAVPSVPRLPFKVDSLYDDRDGTLFVGGHRFVNNEAVGAVARYSPRGQASLLPLPVWGFGATITGFMADGIGGWYFSSESTVDAYVATYQHVLPSFRPDPASKFIQSVGGQRAFVIRPGRLRQVDLAAQTYSGWPRVSTPATVVIGGATATLPEFLGNFAAAPDTDGGIVVAGATPRGYAVRRITRSGSVDPAFGGEVLSQDFESDVICDVCRSNDGIWWVAGATKDFANRRLFVAKYTPPPVAVALLEPDRPLVLNRATGLMEQRIVVTNHTAATADVQVRVSEVPSEVKSVYRAPEQVLVDRGGIKAWTVKVPGLAAGAQRTVAIGYYVPLRRPAVFRPVLEVVPN